MVTSGPVPLLRAVSVSVALLQSGSVLMSVASANTESHAECPWTGWLPEDMLKSEGHPELALPLAGHRRADSTPHGWHGGEA